MHSYQTIQIENLSWNKKKLDIKLVRMTQL
jgi:hypothetical protein